MNKSFLRLAAVPLSIFFILGTLWILWRILQLPSDEELISIAQRYFAAYGYYFAFFSAFIEGILFINWYFPGSLIVFLSVLAARTGELNIFSVLGTVMSGFLLAFFVDYALGKYGWYKLFLKLGLDEGLEKAKTALLRRGPWKIFAMNWHPNLGAVAATAAGILGIPFRIFLLYCFIAVVFWDGAWGAVVYFLGPGALRLMDLRIGIVFLLIWILWIFLRSRRKLNLNAQ